MGTDYTLACTDCKRATYIDRHGAPFAWRSYPHTQVMIEWLEDGIYPRAEPVPLVTLRTLAEGAADYIEDRGDTSIFPDLIEWVAGHIGHQVVLLSDSGNCSRDLAYGDGWERGALL